MEKTGVGKQREKYGGGKCVRSLLTCGTEKTQNLTERIHLVITEICYETTYFVKFVWPAWVCETCLISVGTVKRLDSQSASWMSYSCNRYVIHLHCFDTATPVCKLNDSCELYRQYEFDTRELQLKKKCFSNFRSRDGIFFSQAVTENTPAERHTNQSHFSLTLGVGRVSLFDEQWSNDPKNDPLTWMTQTPVTILLTANTNPHPN